MDIPMCFQCGEEPGICVLFFDENLGYFKRPEPRTCRACADALHEAAKLDPAKTRRVFETLGYEIQSTPIEGVNPLEDALRRGADLNKGRGQA